MFCPDCGLEDKHANQFCRSCGTDLRSIRIAFERPDQIAGTAASAREDIGRAVAAKIRETQSVRELKKVAEDVLPEIEKFFESPEERRMRRMRTGTILSSIGLGVTIGLGIVAVILRKEEFLFLAGLGAVAFMLGLGFVLNGLFLSVPKHARATLPHREPKRLEPAIPASLLQPAMASDTNELIASVTEHTTQHLRAESKRSSGS